MTIRSTLLSGIAGFAVAAAVTFAAQAQGEPSAPLAPPQMENPGATPATAPSAGPVSHHPHHRVSRGQSGPQHSTPAEAAATDDLNAQQVTADAMPAAFVAPAAPAPVAPPAAPAPAAPSPAVPPATP
jgi:ribonuclease E